MSAIPPIDQSPPPQAEKQAAKPAAADAGPKHLGGRPKGAKNKPKMQAATDADPAPPPPRHGNEKPPPALKHPDIAVKEQAKRLDALIAAARERDPDNCGHWRDTSACFDRTGARVDRSAFRPLVAAPVRAVEWAMGIKDPSPTPARVTDAEIESAAGHWEAASVHLGLGEKGAAVLGAVAGTLATVGTALARGLASYWGKRKPGTGEVPAGEKVVEP